MSQLVKPYITSEEYLELERKAEYKSEYLHGEIFAMSGASRQHNLISTNISRELSTQLRDRPCEVYAGDMRVKVTSAGLYTYPDIVVVCGEPKFEDELVDTLLNPTLLVEVLSPSTERYDRMAKTAYYRTLDSLAGHLLVAQEEIRVQHYAKRADGLWQFIGNHRSLDDIVEITSIGCVLRLSDVYEKVEIDPNYKPPPR